MVLEQMMMMLVIVRTTAAATGAAAHDKVVALRLWRVRQELVIRPPEASGGETRLCQRLHGARVSRSRVLLSLVLFGNELRLDELEKSPKSEVYAGKVFPRNGVTDSLLFALPSSASHSSLSLPLTRCSENVQKIP
uniref:Putative secreted protein n=1 Tax=Anopheles triannulatus TaxID=58253 RepID=A0A2M4B3H1_9DIPT